MSRRISRPTLQAFLAASGMAKLVGGGQEALESRTITACGRYGANGLNASLLMIGAELVNAEMHRIDLEDVMTDTVRFPMRATYTAPLGTCSTWTDPPAPNPAFGRS